MAIRMINTKSPFDQPRIIVPYLKLEFTFY